MQQPEALDRLMPVRIMGLARTGSFSALEDYLGVKIESDGDVPVSMGNARRGQVIVSQDGIPLLVHQKKGEGNILFFAGDIGTHPFSRDAVRKALWSAFEQVHVGRDPFDEPGSIFEDPVLPDLLDLENERQYSRVLLLGFLLVYLTGTLYFTLRTPRTEVPTDVQTDAQAEVRTKSRHLGRWISIIILSVGLSLAGHLLFARNVFRNEYAMIDRTVIKPTLGGRYSIARKDVVLVSITDRSYTVTLDAVDSVVLGRKQGYTRVREGSVVAVEDIAVSTWNQQSYTFLTSVEFSLDGSLVRSGDRLDLKITNSSDSTILDALLIYRGVPSLIGTMSPGDHHSSSFEIVSSPIGKIREDATTFSRETDPARYLTLNAILKDPTYRESMESGAVILLGWLSDPIVHASTGDEFISYQEVSILVSEIAFPLPKAGHKE